MDNNDGIIRYKLRRPLTTIDGETVTEIVMDMDALGVPDLDRCLRNAKAFLGKKARIPGVPAFDQTYCSFVAARASGLAIEDIRAMGITDYTAVTLEVQNFLLAGASDEEEETDEEAQARKSGLAETWKTKTMNSATASQESVESYGN